MRIILKKRAQGVTTFLASWVKEKEDRYLVVHNQSTKSSIVHRFKVAKDKVLTFHEYKTFKLGCNKNFEFAIDECQLMMKNIDLDENVKIVSITVEE